MNKLGEEAFEQLIELLEADTRGQSSSYAYRLEEYNTLRALARQIALDGDCFTLADLHVNGYDLLKLGYGGKELGQALDRALDAVIDGTLPNERAALISFLQKEKRPDR